MIDFATLPTDLAAYESFEASLRFPSLNPNTTDACPVSLAEVEQYAEIEAEIDPKALRFVCTADVDGVKFWLWEDASVSSTQKIFVSVEMYEGSSLLSCQWEEDWLTPEKYMAWRYAKGWR